MFSNSPPTDPKSHTSTLDLTEESKKLTSSPHLVADIATQSYPSGGNLSDFLVG